MFKITMRFLAPRVRFTHKELLERGEKVFQCPKCYKVMSYFSLHPERCENLECNEKLPDPSLPHSLSSRIRYHYGLPTEREFKDMQDKLWTKTPNMYSQEKLWAQMPSMYSRL